MPDREIGSGARIGRRKFLAQGSAMVTSAATIAAGRLPADPIVPEFLAPLPIPPVLMPVRRDETTDFYELVQQEGSAEIVPGLRTRVWGYNGSVPGPTIEARRGRKAVVTQTNRLGVPAVVHLHGGITRPESDGFPTDTIAPGEARTYEYDNAGSATTLWYHDHSWHGAGRNLYMGLAGFYLLRDGNEIEGRLPRGAYDVPLMLQDRALGRDGELDYDHRGHRGAAGRTMLVNGVWRPFFEVGARKYRFRILNASNATPVRLALGSYRPLTQIATDQGLLPSPNVLSTISLVMGERIEVVIDFSTYAVGSRVVLENRLVRGPANALMEFRVVRTERDDSIVPRELAAFERWHRSQAIRTRTFVFGGTPTLAVRPGVRWLINGRPFDPVRVDADPRLGDIELWRFVSRGFLGRTMLHPVHTHLAPFQVLSRNGHAPRRQEGGWKDTVGVDDGEEVEVLIKWSGHRGRYLLHCHNLEHEDHSMMARVDVV